MERLVRAWRRADRTAQADAEQVPLASRTLSTRVDEDGMVLIRGRLTPEVGAVLLRALEAALEQVPAAAEEGGEPTVAQRRADALGVLTESALAAKLDPGTAGDRYQVTVHVEGETLPSPAAASHSEPAPAVHVSAETWRGDGVGVIEQGDGLHVAAEVARRIACDAGLVVLRRRTRTIPTALRRALEVRDHDQCRFPGCESRYCDAHHIVHWADGGATALGTLALLCRFHHRAVHEEGFHVVAGADGQLQFLRPDGELLPVMPAPPRWEGAPLAPTLARLAAVGITIGPHTATPDWYGEPLDVAAALDVLWEQPAPGGRPRQIP